EYAQSTPNLTAMGSNLYELIKARGIVAYPDEAMRLAVSRTIALETPRGWRLAKEKTSHKIDVVVALAMASLAAVEQSQRGHVVTVAPVIITAPYGDRFGNVLGDTDAAYAAASGLYRGGDGLIIATAPAEHTRFDYGGRG